MICVPPCDAFRRNLDIVNATTSSVLQEDAHAPSAPPLPTVPSNMRTMKDYMTTS